MTKTAAGSGIRRICWGTAALLIALVACSEGGPSPTSGEPLEERTEDAASSDPDPPTPEPAVLQVSHPTGKWWCRLGFSDQDTEIGCGNDHREFGPLVQRDHFIYEMDGCSISGDAWACSGQKPFRPPSAVSDPIGGRVMVGYPERDFECLVIHGDEPSLSCHYNYFPGDVPAGDNAEIYEIGGCRVTLADRVQPWWFCDESRFSK